LNKMTIKFEIDNELYERIKHIVEKLQMEHIDLSRVICVRSKGSQARRTIARCYALSKVWQKALGIKSHYVIEVISEKFDKLSKAEQDKVLIHELLHIPKSMGGGFKHHNYVTNSRVEKLYKIYKDCKFS